jgi:GT2 family glycosyltransferase
MTKEYFSLRTGHMARSPRKCGRRKFSVVVVNWNGKHLLNDCLKSLQLQLFDDFETIVVDNGSSDGSVEFVREHYPEVQILALPRNLGFCGGNNEGIRRSRGDWLVLLNNDTEVVSGYLSAIDQATHLFPQAGMFASKMLLFDSRSIIDNCGFSVSQAGTAQEIGRNEVDAGQYKLGFQPFGPSGGAAAYSRKLLDTVGLFDEDFFLIYEDVDLAMRARLYGFKCYFVPGATVYHKYRMTLAQMPSWQVSHGQKNVEYFYLKNMPAGLIVKYGALHVLYNVGGFFYFARKGLLRPFLSAKFRVLRNLPLVWRKRRIIQTNRTVSTAELTSLLTGNYVTMKRLRKFLGLSRVPPRQEYGR